MAVVSYAPTAKRWLDLAVVGVLSPIWVPAFGVLAVLIRASGQRQVLFRQVRPGLQGEPFTLFKFCTMTDKRNDESELLEDAQRLTGLGRFLRRSSLDELPELWNVLRGDMSLVGPRPLLVEYLPLYSEEQARRHEVRPGLTGLAQVRGRNAISWEEKLAHDVDYVRRVSLALDLRILLETIGAVFSGRGVSAEGHATAPRFRGNARGNQGGSVQGGASVASGDADVEAPDVEACVSESSSPTE